MQRSGKYPPLGAGKFIPMITKRFAVNKLRCLEVVLAALWLAASLILPVGYLHGEYRRIKARVKRTSVMTGEVGYPNAGQKIRSAVPSVKHSWQVLREVY